MQFSGSSIEPPCDRASNSCTSTDLYSHTSCTDAWHCGNLARSAATKSRRPPFRAYSFSVFFDLARSVARSGFRLMNRERFNSVRRFIGECFIDCVALLERASGGCPNYNLNLRSRRRHAKGAAHGNACIFYLARQNLRAAKPRNDYKVVSISYLSLSIATRSLYQRTKKGGRMAALLPLAFWRSVSA